MIEYFVVFLVGVIVAAIFQLKRTYTYWTSRDVLQIEPTWLLGNTKEFIFGRKSFGEMLVSWYTDIRRRGHKYGGAYFFTKPVLVVTDPEIIKRVISTDFIHFNSHAVVQVPNEEAEPLIGHLFNLEGQKWKDMRTKLTPTFTSGKMKMMFNTIRDCSNGLSDILSEHAKTGDAVEIKDILARFTTDVIGSCAFGLDCNSLKDPNAIFRVYGRKVFDNGRLLQFKILLVQSLPTCINKILGLKLTDRDVEKFFIDAVNDTVKYRETNNVVRKDFMHLLLQLKNQGKVTDGDDFKSTGNEEKEGLTMTELTAQAFVFFIAGFETSSTTMTYALYELARQQDIQNKLRQEINEVLKNHNGEVTYDSVSEMKLMDKVVNETLRMHTPLPFLPRRCTKEYKMPGTNLIIEKDIDVQIPIQALHMDPEYYPNPKIFDPERFSEDNKAKRPAFTYLPFGDGPRICIGLRFGVLQSKIGLIAILRNYKITLNEKTPIPLKLDVNSLIKSPEGGMWLNVEKI